MPWRTESSALLRIVSTDKSIGVFFPLLFYHPSLCYRRSTQHLPIAREGSVTTRQARPSSGESRNLNDSVISGSLLEALLFYRPHCKVIFLVPVILNSIDRAPRVEISSAERREKIVIKRATKCFGCVRKTTRVQISAVNPSTLASSNSFFLVLCKCISS